jgi:hypothetical protein
MVNGWEKVATLASAFTAVAAVAAVVVAALIARRQDGLSRRVVSLEEERSKRERQQHDRATSAIVSMGELEGPNGSSDLSSVDWAFDLDVWNQGGVAATGLELRFVGGGKVLARSARFSVAAGASARPRIQIKSTELRAAEPWVYVGDGHLVLELVDGDDAPIDERLLRRSTPTA